MKFSTMVPNKQDNTFKPVNLANDIANTFSNVTLNTKPLTLTQDEVIYRPAMR